MLKKNDIITLTIDNCSLDGSGVGHYDGLAVFVPMAFTGEKINAHILKVKKNCAFAKIESVLSPAPERIEPGCPVYSRCGGCAFRHITYEAEAAVKQDAVEQILHRIGKIDIQPESILTAAPDRYRNKAQYPVAREERVKIGFYSPHSHRVADCRDCLLQPASFAAILDIFEEFIESSATSVYDENTGEGLLRHIYLRSNSCGDIMVCPVINGNSLPDSDRLVSLLTERCPEVKSIILNINKSDTNVILGGKCVPLWGSDCIIDELCGLNFRISPLSFYQVNRPAAELLYRKAREYACLTGSETVLDLYCGTGTIGLSMAGDAGKIIGVEIVEQAVGDAKENAARNGITNAEFICADAFEAALKLEERGTLPDVVILDPPRKGCGAALIETVARMNPQRVVYVSCDPATLARDLAIFDSLGYKTEAVTPVDMFPRTAHTECVAKLIRCG